MADRLMGKYPGKLGIEHRPHGPAPGRPGIEQRDRPLCCLPGEFLLVADVQAADGVTPLVPHLEGAVPGRNSHDAKPAPANLELVLVSGTVAEPDLLEPLGVVDPGVHDPGNPCRLLQVKKDCRLFPETDIAGILPQGRDFPASPHRGGERDILATDGGDGRRPGDQGGDIALTQFLEIVDGQNTPSVPGEGPDHGMVEKRAGSRFTHPVIDIDVGGLALHVADIIIPHPRHGIRLRRGRSLSLR